jgi:outer membrane protein assembly factor BamB
MDLLAYFENWENEDRGFGMVYVWDVGSETRPLIACWDRIKVDAVCVSSVSMRVGIMSVEPIANSKISIFEIPGKTILCEFYFGPYDDFDHHFTCNLVCDKVAAARRNTAVAFDVCSIQPLYEFAGANEMAFSHDNRFVYVKYDFRVAQCDVLSGQELRTFNDTMKQTCLSCFQQNLTGTRLTWLKVAANRAVHGSLQYDMVILDTISGQIINTWCNGFGWTAGFCDDEMVVAVDEDCVQLYSIETAELTPTLVNKRSVAVAGVTSGIITAFNFTYGCIHATDLTTGVELYSFRLPNPDRPCIFQDLRLSVNNTVVLM